MLKTKNYKFWFCTGSQDLYGDECLEHVAEHAKIIVAKLNESGVLPYEVIWKPTLITNELIRKTFNAFILVKKFVNAVLNCSKAIPPSVGLQMNKINTVIAIITAPLFTAPPYSFINSSMGIFLLSSLLDSPAGEICMGLINPL